MADRDNGEFLLDIAVTIHPEHDEHLVGLWKLDSLEASFGAGGYKRGEIHHLNTLNLYGGLQAEAREAHRRRTHVLFRSAYCLVYETTRKFDNCRNLFSGKDAYHMSQRFVSDMENVLKILQNEAPTKGYGVRDEIRLGCQALEAVAETIDQTVRLLVCCTRGHVTNWPTGR